METRSALRWTAYEGRGWMAVGVDEGTPSDLRDEAETAAASVLSAAGVGRGTSMGAGCGAGGADEDGAFGGTDGKKTGAGKFEADNGAAAAGSASATVSPGLA